MIPTFLFLRVRFLDDDCLCYGSIPLYSLKFFPCQIFCCYRATGGVDRADAFIPLEYLSVSNIMNMHSRI